MLNNKTLLIVSGIAVAAVILVFLFVGKESKTLSPVIKAIPNKAAFIIETSDFNYLTNKISKNENLKSLLSQSKFSKHFYNQLIFIDSVIRHEKTFSDFINQKTVILSAHYLGQNNLDYLFATGFSGKKSDIDKINQSIKKLNDNSPVNTINFAGAEIFKISLKGSKSDIYYSFFEDYFLLSYSEIILQKSIKNINSGASLFDSPNFKSLYQKTGKKNDATLYICYENLFSYIEIKGQQLYRSRFNLLRNFADWTALDIQIKKKDIKFTGHTTLKSEMQYLKLFENVTPENAEILKILPEKTSSFVSLNIGTGSQFKYKYEDYCGLIRTLNDYQVKLAEFNKEYDFTDDKNTLYELIGGEVSLFTEDVFKNGKEQNTFFAVSYKEKSDIEKFLNIIIKTHSAKKNEPEDTYKSNYISNDNEYIIYKNPEIKLPEIFFGELFKNIDANYICLIKNFIVFGENKTALYGLIDSFEKDKTLKRKSQNYSFLKSLADQSNILFFIDPIHAESILKSLFINFSFDKTQGINRIQGPAVQFIADNYPIYTTIKISFNSDRQQSAESVWELRLDTVISEKPYIVLNHETLEKEIVIQDLANKIYLIDKNGNILWNRQLDGIIISNIYQIDYYENSKLQLIFNTKNKIYCIDRKGNWLEGYPIELKSPATNGLSVFDYDNDKNYRIFIAGENKKIYLYNKDGKIVDGWVFEHTQSEVTNEINHYKNADNDYITFRDKTNIYILNRRGETRIVPDINIPLSDNNKIFFHVNNEKAFFTTTSPAGTIYLISETGKTENINIKKVSDNHHFLQTDVTNDNFPDFIFTDKNSTTVYDGKTRKLFFSYEFDNTIENELFEYVFSDNDIRLGATSADKIYLITNNGKISEGFPLNGTGRFSITKFTESEEFSLIVGNKDNYLYKYQIK